MRKHWSRAAPMTPIWGSESVFSGTVVVFQPIADSGANLQPAQLTAHYSWPLASRQRLQPPKSVDLEIYFQCPGQDGLSRAISASLIQQQPVSKPYCCLLLKEKSHSGCAPSFNLQYGGHEVQNTTAQEKNPLTKQKTQQQFIKTLQQAENKTNTLKVPCGV